MYYIVMYMYYIVMYMYYIVMYMYYIVMYMYMYVQTWVACSDSCCSVTVARYSVLESSI